MGGEKTAHSRLNLGSPRRGDPTPFFDLRGLAFFRLLIVHAQHDFVPTEERRRPRRVEIAEERFAARNEARFFRPCFELSEGFGLGLRASRAGKTKHGEAAGGNGCHAEGWIFWPGRGFHVRGHDE